MSKSKTSEISEDENDASRDRLSRLFLLADEKLRLLEKQQLDGGCKRSAADNEKDAKAMITLTNLYEKLVGLKDAQAAQKDNVQSDEAERICGQLAERIERLQQERIDRPPYDLESKATSNSSS